MQIIEEKRIRTSESTISSDSGVMIDDTISIHNDLTNGGNVSLKNHENKIKNDDNNDNKQHENDDIKSSNSSNTNNNYSVNNELNNDDNVNNKIINNRINENSNSEKTTPTSTRSNKISIVSIDDDADSSIIDSDSDFDENLTNHEFIIQKLGQQTSHRNGDGGVVVINQRLENDLCGTSASSYPSGSGLLSPGKPHIGSIALQNSTDITFGDKTFYQGPVTIKQFLLDSKNKWKPKDGNDNHGFEVEIDDGKTNSDQNSPPNPPYKKFMFDTKIAAMIGVIILISAVLGSITYTAIQFTTPKIYKADGREQRHVVRGEWLAQPPNEELTPLDLPVHRIIIAHTATENCTTQAECTFRVRFIQTFHMESRGWDDIGYNFLVGGDGAVYDGRGWDKMGAHTKYYNTDSICIAFIGTFTKAIPPERQLNAAKKLIEEGIKLGKLVPDYKLFAHRQLIASESPGAALYEIIKTWPHWSQSIDQT